MVDNKSLKKKSVIKKSVKNKSAVQVNNEPPQAYQNFVNRFPALAKAWDATSEAGTAGSFSEKQIRLIKLAIAVGAMREGAVRSSVRKAVAIGVTQKDLDQVVCLAAGTLGFPSTVAVFSWMESAKKRT